MVDWNSPVAIQIAATIFYRLQLFCIGLYTWQFLSTLRRVDWPLMTRRLKFRFIYIPYFVGRYLMLILSFAAMIFPRVSRSAICFPVQKLFTAAGNIVVSTSSTNFLIRTLIIWKHNRIMQGVLFFMSGAQWAVALIFGSRDSGHIHASELSFCGGSYPSDQRNLIVFFLYTLCFDAVILISTILGLSLRPGHARSGLWVALYQHNLWYLIITLAFNIPTVVLALLNLNSMMNMLFGVLAPAVSVIASSEAFISLIDRGDNGITSGGSTLRARETNTFSHKEDPLTTHIEMPAYLAGGPSDVEIMVDRSPDSIEIL